MIPESKSQRLEKNVKKDNFHSTQKYIKKSD